MYMFLQMTTEKVPCVVVVTGGAGFLGQHIVGLLQEHASHVTEIRVLDVIPYVNKLGKFNAILYTIIYIFILNAI